MWPSESAAATPFGVEAAAVVGDLELELISGRGAVAP